MTRILDITTDFLDSLGEVCIVTTDKVDWVLMRVPSYGLFISMSSDREVVYQISDLDSWQKGKELTIKDVKPTGTYSVRDIFPKLKLHCDPSFKGPAVEVWINAILPIGNPVNVDKIRFEAYTDQAQALTDAEEELISGGDVSNVITTKVPLHIPSKVKSNDAS